MLSSSPNNRRHKLYLHNRLPMAVLVKRKAHQPVFICPKFLYRAISGKSGNLNTSNMPVKYIYFSGVCISMVYSEIASIPRPSSFSAFSIGELFLFSKPCALDKEMSTSS